MGGTSKGVNAIVNCKGCPECEVYALCIANAVKIKDGKSVIDSANCQMCGKCLFAACGCVDVVEAT